MSETLAIVATAEDFVAVGVNFTPQSKTASARASRIAKATNSRVLEIHVVPDSAVDVIAPSSATVAASVAPTRTNEGRAALRAAADLAEQQLVHEAAGVESQPIVRVGRPPEELAHLAEECGAWLLVVGAGPAMATGETLLLGTTAELAIRRGATPVLLAREDPWEPYARVLVPLDVAYPPSRVLQTVAKLAPDAAYDVVHFISAGGPRETKTQAHRDSIVAALTKRCAEAGLDPRRTRVHAFIADPRNGILVELKRGAPNLVAVGTHARTGVSRLVHRSIADYAIHTASGTDVLVVPFEE